MPRKPNILDRVEKNLLVCPNCHAQGTIEFLGEIDDNGDFVVERKHKTSGNKVVRKLTKVTGTEFLVRCGQCGEPVYRKGGVDGKDSGKWKFGIHRETFSFSLGTAGTLG